MNPQEPAAIDGFIKTLNQTGFQTVAPDPFSQAFIDHSKNCQNPVLEIGAAYGVAALPALKNGATVIANDLSEEHLDILFGKTSPDEQKRLTLLPGRFPEDIHLKENFLDAVLACRVFHFFTGDQLRAGIRKIFSWLKPGGKFFLVGETPYVKTITHLIPVYEQRLQDGEEWPGFFDDVQIKDSDLGKAIQKHFHAFDPQVLRREFESAGFEIEKIETFARPDFPEWVQLDGRESLGVIGVKTLSGS